MYDAIRASLRELKQSEDQLDPAYNEYRHLCLAKHGNPAMQKFAGLTRTESGHRIHLDTFASDAVAIQIRIGLCYAVRPVLFALAVTLTHQRAPVQSLNQSRRWSAIATDCWRNVLQVLRKASPTPNYYWAAVVVPLAILSKVTRISCFQS